MAETKTKTLFSSESVKAWVGGIVAALAAVSTQLVPDSTAGTVVATALAFVTAVAAVFGFKNQDAKS
jgi:hypothetical protein